MITLSCSRCEADVNTETPHTVLSIRERKELGTWHLYAKTLCAECAFDFQAWWITSMAKRIHEQYDD